MPQYAILRFAKRKGGYGALEAHHERKKEKYASNPDVDTSRSQYNFHIIKPSNSYRKEIDSRIQAAKCRVRKDSIRFIDTLITASPHFFENKSMDSVIDFFRCATTFISQRIGQANIFSAVIHMDEKPPHMHLCFTPITEDGRLSAKEIIGNRTKLVEWQDNFFEHMVKRYPDLERGESASVTGRKHIPTRVFKQVAQLGEQAKQLQSMLGSLNPLNASKMKKEITMAFFQFFPAMERLETNFQKYSAELHRLRSQLDSESLGITERIEYAKQQKEMDRLRQFYMEAPEEYKVMYQKALAEQGRNKRNVDKRIRRSTQ